MITQTHQQLENWNILLTLITGLWGGYSVLSKWKNRGWMQAKLLEKKMMDQTISSLQASEHIQFTRIDELKESLSRCVSRELHDQMQKELSERMDRFQMTISQQITDGFAQINIRIDRFADKRISND